MTVAAAIATMQTKGAMLPAALHGQRSAGAEFAQLLNEPIPAVSEANQLEFRGPLTPNQKYVLEATAPVLTGLDTLQSQAAAQRQVPVNDHDAAPVHQPNAASDVVKEPVSFGKQPDTTASVSPDLPKNTIQPEMTAAEIIPALAPLSSAAVAEPDPTFIKQATARPGGATENAKPVNSLAATPAPTASLVKMIGPVPAPASAQLADASVTAASSMAQISTESTGPQVCPQTAATTVPPQIPALMSDQEDVAATPIEKPAAAAKSAAAPRAPAQTHPPRNMRQNEATASIPAASNANPAPVNKPQDTAPSSSAIVGTSPQPVLAQPQPHSPDVETAKAPAASRSAPMGQNNPMSAQFRTTSSWLDQPHAASDPANNTQQIASEPTAQQAVHAPPQTAASQVWPPPSPDAVQQQAQQPSPGNSPNMPPVPAVTPGVTGVSEDVASQWTAVEDQAPDQTSAASPMPASGTRYRAQTSRTAGTSPTIRAAQQSSSTPAVTAASDQTPVKPSGIFDLSLRNAAASPVQPHQARHEGSTAPEPGQPQMPVGAASQSAMTTSRPTLRTPALQPDPFAADAPTPNTTPSVTSNIQPLTLATSPVMTPLSEVSPEQGNTTAAPTQPSQQIGEALVAMATSPANNQQVTVHLHPAELGGVHVTIERIDNNNTKIVIAAEKTDTLELLQRSQAQLHQSLDLAGIPSLGREVTFHAAPPQTVATNTDSSASTGNLEFQGQSNFAQSNQQGGGGSQTPYAQAQAATVTSQRDAASSASADAAAAPRAYRLGLDITA